MNKLIIQLFTEIFEINRLRYLSSLADQNAEKIKTDYYRMLTTSKILSTLKKLDFVITDADQLMYIPDLGDSTRARVKEILETGSLKELDEKTKPYADFEAVKQLSEIIGIGFKGAIRMIKNKITSVELLEKAVANNTIKVSNMVKLGLKYRNILDTHIPYHEISTVIPNIKKYVALVDPTINLLVCGSYRRNNPYSSDIDILMWHPDVKVMEDLSQTELLHQIIQVMTEKGVILDNLTNDVFKTKYMGFFKYGKYPVRRLDIRFIPCNYLAAAKLYFTGPFQLNTMMRKNAKNRSYILNEYGLHDKDGVLIPTATEKDIFKKLGMPYLTPEERNQYA